MENRHIAKKPFKNAFPIGGRFSYAIFKERDDYEGSPIDHPPGFSPNDPIGHRVLLPPADAPLALFPPEIQLFVPGGEGGLHLPAQPLSAFPPQRQAKAFPSMEATEEFMRQISDHLDELLEAANGEKKTLDALEVQEQKQRQRLIRVR